MQILDLFSFLCIITKILEVFWISTIGRERKIILVIPTTSIIFLLTNQNKRSILYNGDWFMERQILHIDVNNAFLSWSAIERLKNGEKIDIRTIPSAICGDENKRSGIILAKSSLAKSMGVVTGETVYQAMKKCPSLKLYSSDDKVYRKYSDSLYNLLLEYTDKIERFSVDECFLDMTNFLMGDTLLAKAHEISQRVKNELSFTVNIGVSSNKLLAKMA